MSRDASGQTTRIPASAERTWKAGLEAFWRHTHDNGWADLPIRDLVESGLLQQINRRFLWDLGLALTVNAKSFDGGEPDYARAYLCVTGPVPADRIESGGADREEAWEAFVEARRAMVEASEGTGPGEEVGDG